MFALDVDELLRPKFTIFHRTQVSFYITTEVQVAGG